MGGASAFVKTIRRTIRRTNCGGASDAPNHRKHHSLAPLAPRQSIADITAWRLWRLASSSPRRVPARRRVGLGPPSVPSMHPWRCSESENAGDWIPGLAWSATPHVNDTEGGLKPTLPSLLRRYPVHGPSSFVAGLRRYKRLDHPCSGRLPACHSRVSGAYLIGRPAAHISMVNSREM